MLDLSSVQFEDEKPEDFEPKADAAPTAPKLDVSSVKFDDAPNSSEDGPSALSRGLYTGFVKENPKLIAKGLEGAQYLTDDPAWKERFKAGQARAEGMVGTVPKEYQTRAGNLEDSIDNWAEFKTWLGENTGQAGATSAGVLGGAGAGAAAGWGVAGPWGATVGGLGGAGIAAYGMNFADAYQSIEQELKKVRAPKVNEGASFMDEATMTALDPNWKWNQEEDIRKTSAEWAKWVAVPMALLDVASLGPIITRLGIGPAKNAVKRALIKRLIQEGGKAIGREAGTEMLQTAIPQATVAVQEDVPFWTKEHMFEIAGAGLSAAGMGVTGAASGIKADVVEQQPSGLQVVPPPVKPGATINVSPTSPSQVSGQPKAATSPATPPPTSSPQTNTGTATAPAQKPATNVAVGNPSSAPTESETKYPKAEKAKKAGRKKDPVAAVPPVTSEVIAPDHAAALAGTATGAEIARQDQALAEADAARVARRSAPVTPGVPETPIAPASPVTDDLEAPSALDEDYDEATGEPVLSSQTVQENIGVAPETTPEVSTPEVRRPRILPDTTAVVEEGSGLADKTLENLAASEPKVVKPKHRGKKEREARVRQNAIADEVVPGFAPDSSEDTWLDKNETKQKTARGNMLQRARKMLKAAEAKGLRAIPTVFADNTDPEMNRNDAQMLLSEAAHLVRHKSPQDADFMRFWERERGIRSGDAEIIAGIRAERKAEGDAAKNVGSKGKVDHIAATPTESKEITPEVSEEKSEPVEERTPDATDAAKGEKLAKTAQAADMEAKEASSTKSQRAGPNLFNEETAAKVTSGEKLSPEEKKKLIDKMNAGLKLGGMSDGKPKVTPKVAEVQEKVAKKALDKKAEAKKAPEKKPKRTAAEMEAHVKSELSKQASGTTGLKIRIKNLKESYRKGVDKAGNAWAHLLKYNYGEILGFKGNDGEAVDVILGSLPPGTRGWYVIDQMEPNTNKFDEHKVLTGFVNVQAATEGYFSMFGDNSGPSRFGGIRHMSDEEFKAWLDAAPKAEPVALEAEQMQRDNVPELLLEMEIFGPTLGKVRALRKQMQQLYETGLELWRKTRDPRTKAAISRRNRAREYITLLMKDAVDAMEIAQENASDPAYAKRFTDVAVERLSLVRDAWRPDLIETDWDAVAAKFEADVARKEAEMDPEHKAMREANRIEEEKESKENWTETGSGTDVAQVEQNLTQRMAAVKQREGESTIDHLNRVAKKLTTFSKEADNLLPFLKGTKRAFFGTFVSRISRWVSDVPVYVVPSEVFYDYGGNATTEAMYLGGARVILLSDAKSSAANLAHSLLHEGIHAAFIRATHARSDIEGMVDKIARAAQAAGMVKSSHYAFTNVDEFIAEAFSNPVFAEMLSKIKAPQELAYAAIAQRMGPANKFISLWDKLLDTIANALGITSRGEYNLFQITMQIGAELERDLARYGMVANEDADYIGAIERRVNRATIPGSPWMTPSKTDLELYEKAQARNNVYTLTPEMEVAELQKDVARRMKGGASTAERVWTKFITLKQMARWYSTTAISAPLDNLVSAISAQMPQLSRFKKEASELAQEFIDWSQKNKAEAVEFASIGMELTYLEGNVIDGETGASILAHPTNQHYGKSIARYWQGKAQLPALQERYNKLSPEARRLFQKMQKFYSTTQNRMVKDTVTALLETAEVTIDPAYLPGLVKRVMDKEMNDADKALLPSTLFHGLQKEAAFHKVKGAYFPSMRYGDFVVQTRDKIKDTMGGTLSGNRVMFRNKSRTAARKAAEAFVKKSDLKMTDFRMTFIDNTTGKEVSADVATGLNDVDYAFEATMMTDGVYFFESDKAARDFAEENPEGHDEIIADVQDRIGQGYHAHILSGSQMSSIMKSVEQRLSKTDPAKVDMIRAILTQSAARLMEGNRITSRRLKRRKVTGASKDFARNVLQYGEAAGKHIVTARAAPQIRQAMKEINDLISGYEGKDKNRLVQIRNELEQRVQMGTLDPGKPNQTVQDLLALSYFGRLFSPAYSIINAMQPWMIAAPMLNGKFGFDKGTYALARAYKDMGFGDNVISGIKNTWEVTKNFTKAGIPGTNDLLGNVKKKLAAQPDGAALVKMIDALIESNDISETSGFEIEGSVAEGRGKWGQTLARVDRISRQLPLSVEIMNRAATAVASYRLAKAAHYSDEKATKFAQDMVDQTQMDYTNANQPRFFNKSGLWRLAFQFKKYAQGVTYLLADLTRQAFKGASIEEKRIAQKQLGHLIAMQVLMAGTFGLPALELIKVPFILAGVLGLGDGWEDQEDYLRKLVNSLLGEGVGEALSNGIVPTTLGLDIQERVGMGNVWFFGEPDLTGTAAERVASMTLWMAQQAIGSGGMLASEFTEGLAGIVDGEGTLSSWLKGTSKILPIKTIRDAAKAADHYLGGKTDAAEFATQVVGFKSAKKAREDRQRGVDIRRGLREKSEGKRLSAALRSARSPGEKARITAKIREFNRTANFKNRVSIKTIEKYREAN